MTCYELQSGRSETEAYAHFGKRCQVQAYMKLSALLSQNIRKGSNDLLRVLRQEADNAFAERKNLAKKLWRAVMSQIHEDLPSESFSVPSGIVTATVCSRSGKLPIAGLCDGTLRTEYFAENTIPTETCDVHYAGQVCQYSMLPAREFCPFKVECVVELTPVEDVSLQSGSSTGTTQVTNEDGTVSEVPIPAPTSNMCPHDEVFFATPGYEATIEAQRAEINQRNAEAAAAAAEAAAQQQPAPPQPEQPPAQ